MGARHKSNISYKKPACKKLQVVTCGFYVISRIDSLETTENLQVFHTATWHEEKGFDLSLHFLNGLFVL